MLVDRRTRAVELLRAGVDRFEPVSPDPDGWVASEVLRTAFRREEGEGGAAGLRLRRTDDPERELLMEPC